MSDTRLPIGDRPLRYLTAAVAVFVAGIHLYWALPIAARQLEYGIVHDPRPILFLLAAVAVFTGIGLAVQGFDRRPLYVGGIVLSLTFMVGYGAWHTVLDHGAFWPGRPAHGHSQEAFHLLLYRHLANDPVALVSKVSEVVLIALCGILYVRES